jgi:hypothetical protein
MGAGAAESWRRISNYDAKAFHYRNFSVELLNSSRVMTTFSFTKRFPSDLAKSTAIKRRLTVSLISTLHNFMNHSRPAR